jgi:L-lactate dehydrogenase complex protein LldG
LTVAFAEKFTELAGKFIYCAHEGELVVKLDNLIKKNNWEKIYSTEANWLATLDSHDFNPVTTNNLATCDAAITLCTHLIARTGTIVLSSQQESGRVSSVYAPIHICVAYSHQLVFDIADSLQQFKDNIEQMPSMISFASGPSRTADIEKTLVVGVHGPKEVYCFFVDKGIA